MSPLVPPGTPIAVVAPCGIYSAERFDAGLEILRAQGHDPRPLPGLLTPWRYLAASDDHRAGQLQQALTDPAFGAVWIARGGYGLTRILDRLDLGCLPRRPVIGFSDVTALFAALRTVGAGPAVHAPVVHSLSSTDPASLAALFGLLEGRPVPSMAGEPWLPGEAVGPLVGGNLCLLAATCGTPWQLDARGAVLVLEEVGEPGYRIDRELQQLISAGVLDGVAGIAVGDLAGCDPPGDAGYSLRDLFVDHLAPLAVPVLGGLPIGHGPRNHPFVWGAPARLSADRLTLVPG